MREKIREFVNRIKDFIGSFGAQSDEVVTASGDPEELKNAILEEMKREGKTGKEAKEALKDSEELLKTFSRLDPNGKKHNDKVEEGVTLLPSERGESPFIETVDTPTVEEGRAGARTKGGREIDE